MRRFYKNIFILFLLLLIALPGPLFAAEVLQIRSSNLLQIGDQNRTYSVQLACFDLNKSNEDEVREFLKDELPRRTKVNLRPLGSIDGVLLARVNVIGNDKDLSQELSEAGLGNFTCSPLS